MSTLKDSPPDSARLFSEPEDCPYRTEHLRIPRSWRSVAPQMLFAFLAAASVAVISAAFEFYGVRVTLPWSKEPFTLPLTPLIFAVFMARPIFLLKDCFHELRCTQLRSISGRLSGHRTRIDIPYEDILGVRVHQSILQRLLGVGDILAWTASAEKPEVVMRGIGGPEFYCDRVTEKLRKAQNKTLPTSGKV